MLTMASLAMFSTKVAGEDSPPIPEPPRDYTIDEVTDLDDDAFVLLPLSDRD